MKDGKLLTCGTSLFLKHHFGVGYTLKFDFAEPFDVTSVIDEAENVASDSNGSHLWRIQHGAEPRLPELLSNLSAVGAKNVTIELTTLEEVFLKTGKEDQEDEEEDGTRDGTAEEEGAAAEDDIEGGNTSSYEAVANVWSKLATRKKLDSTKKFLLVQHFMMKNAWKIKGSVALNIIMPVGSTSYSLVLGWQ